MNGLILHAGARKATFDEVASTRTPVATETYQPVPHGELLELVKRELSLSSMNIVDEAYGLWRGGQRLFGVLQLENDAADYGLTIGIRNSHDKTMPASVALGSLVFVCDNMAFSGEVTMRRKHTVNIFRDLPGLVSQSVAALIEGKGRQAERIQAYKDMQLSDEQAHDFMIQGIRRRVMPVTKLAKWIQEWDRPKHDVFKERTLWSLFNGATEALKGSLAELPTRTKALHGLSDQFAGIEGVTVNAKALI